MSNEERNEATDVVNNAGNAMMSNQGNRTFGSITAFIEALPAENRDIARDLLSSPEKFNNHLKVHREANQEAKERRLALEAIWRVFDIEPPSRSELTEVTGILDDLFEGGEFHPDRYDALLRENEDVIIDAIENGEADPEDFGLIEDEETGELTPIYDEEMDEDEEYLPDEIEEEIALREQRIAELEASARRAELKAIALQNGVAPDRVDDFLKLYTDPEPSKDEKGDDIPFDDLRKQKFEEYREKYPIFFADGTSVKQPVRTDGAPIPPNSAQAAALAEAINTGNVEEALKNAPTEKMINI